MVEGHKLWIKGGLHLFTYFLDENSKTYYQALSEIVRAVLEVVAFQNTPN